MEELKDTLQGVGLLALILIPMAAWATHIFVCLLQAKYVLLIAGAIMFPIGIIHGIGVWFGADW